MKAYSLYSSSKTADLKPILLTPNQYRVIIAKIHTVAEWTFYFFVAYKNDLYAFYCTFECKT